MLQLLSCGLPLLPRGIPSTKAIARETRRYPDGIPLDACLSVCSVDIDTYACRLRIFFGWSRDSGRPAGFERIL